MYGQYRPYIKVSIVPGFIPVTAYFLKNKIKNYGSHGFQEIETLLVATGKEAVIFSSSGPAGIFAIYSNPGIDLGWTFMNEFFAVGRHSGSQSEAQRPDDCWTLIQDFFLGLVIWGVLDPSNIFVSTTTGPVIIAMGKCTPLWISSDADDIMCTGYATVVWGYVPGTVATNAARDLGKYFSAHSRPHPRN